MGDKILSQTDCVIIAEGGRGPVVPYPNVDHADGKKNYGFLDVKANPELIDSIPEVQGWPEFKQLLQVINGPESSLMSLGCEKSYFPYDGKATKFGITTYIGSYTDVAFSDIPMNQDRSNLLTLAQQIRDQINPIFANTGARVDLTLQQSPSLFGVPDCWTIQLKLRGYGRDNDEARKMWGAGASELLKVIENIAVRSNY